MATGENKLDISGLIVTYNWVDIVRQAFDGLDRVKLGVAKLYPVFDVFCHRVFVLKKVR